MGAAADKMNAAQDMADRAERRQMMEDLTKRNQLPDTSQGMVKGVDEMTLDQLRRYHRDMMNRRQ